MIAYGTREFYPVAEQKAKEYFDKIKEYVFEDEEALCCFAHDEAVALFTNRRLIFLNNAFMENHQKFGKEITFLKYKAIKYHTAVWSEELPGGKLVLGIPEEYSLSFFMPNKKDIRLLARLVSKYI